jgi:SPP1 gp7 family putative phage head morphogenesis protein
VTPPTTPPPGQPVPPGDPRWPGWAVDVAIAAAGALALASALSAAVGVAALVAAAAMWHRRGRRKVTSEDVRGWLARRGVADDVVQALDAPLRNVLADGWEAGSLAAEAIVGHVQAGHDVRDDAVTATVDWARFVPGRPDAARLVLSEDGADVGLLELLERADVTISGVAQTRLDEIAAVLADGLEQGRTIDEIAMALRGVLDNPVWAKTVAWTETNRAMSAAALAGYAEAGFGASEWMTALDQRVCPRCGRNEDAGPVPIGEPYPSGDEHPPGHPRCRCALVPVVDADADFMAELDALAEDLSS